MISVAGTSTSSAAVSVFFVANTIDDGLYDTSFGRRRGDAGEPKK
jgi:hypothetical protein